MKLRVPPTEKNSPSIEYLRTPFKVQVEYIWESLLETSRIACSALVLRLRGNAKDNWTIQPRVREILQS